VTARDVTRAGLWKAVPGRTRAGFEVRKLGLIRVRGEFTVHHGGAELAADGRPLSALAVLDAASFVTGNARRDADVVGRRFLDAARHPLLTYRADRIEPVDGGGWLVRGHLAVRERRAPLDLTVSAASGAGPDEVTVTCRGLLDRRATGLPAPRWLIGRWITVEVTAVLGAATATATAAGSDR
jgi:polyisoprenoid-binding protein YceI